jgi:hypothetical protein
MGKAGQRRSVKRDLIRDKRDLIFSQNGPPIHGIGDVSKTKMSKETYKQTYAGAKETYYLILSSCLRCAKM